MFKLVLLLFLIGHVISDFYFQPSDLVFDRKLSFKQNIKSNAFYLLMMIIITLPIFKISLLKWVFLITLIHLIWDIIIAKIRKRDISNEQLAIRTYLVGQIISLSVIIMTSLSIYFSNETIDLLVPVQEIIGRLTLDPLKIISWVFILLIIIQPFSMLIKLILYRYRPMTDEKKTGHPNAGALIGVLERLIILSLLSLGQYSAIGFVLTAKSIARYNKIAEDPEFSEYYLLGTLLSSLLVVGAYILIL